MHLHVPPVSGRRAAAVGLLALLAACGGEERREALPRAPYIDADADGWPLPQDCDDTVPGVNPGAPERCNGSDDDCDGVEDDAPEDGVVAWLDHDRDGWGDSATRGRWCGDPDQDDRPWSSLHGDCDDGDLRVHPGAAESCATQADDDCDGAANDPDALGCTPWHLDVDGDGLGTETTLCLCAAEGSWRAEVAGDCDDSDPDVGSTCGLGGAIDLADADVVVTAPAFSAAGRLVAAFGDAGGGSDLVIGGAGSASDLALWRLRGPFGAVADLSAAAARYQRSGITQLYGLAVSGGHDLDDDGDEDLAIGVYAGVVDSPPIEGRVHVIDRDASGEIDLAATGASVTLNRAFTAYAFRVVVTPDTDGDGLADLFVGGTDDRSAWLFAGPIVGEMDIFRADMEFHAPSGAVGAALAAPGDLDGDGLADLAVGGATSGGGTAWVLRGGATGELEPGDAAATLLGVDHASRFGLGLAGPGDLDGDARADLVVSAFEANDGPRQAGAAWVFAGPLAGSLTPDDAVARVSGAADNDFASVLAAPGDLDGDGLADLALGALGQDGAGTDAGAAYVFFGPLAGALSTRDAHVRLYGAAGGENAGAALAGGADLDGDGRPDLVIGAPGADFGGSASGGAYVVNGGPR